jgi:diaminopimelate decarboxylase
LAQASPRFGYDQKAIEDHARAYKKAFNAEGISEYVFPIAFKAFADKK